jgi:hypothetical protein
MKRKTRGGEEWSNPRRPWFTPVILATQETEINRSAVPSPSTEKKKRTLICSQDSEILHNSRRPDLKNDCISELSLVIKAPPFFGFAPFSVF